MTPCNCEVCRTSERLAEERWVAGLVGRVLAATSDVADDASTESPTRLAELVDTALRNVNAAISKALSILRKGKHKMSPDSTPAEIAREILEAEPLAYTPNPYQRRILFALNMTGKHIYAGTVSASVVAKRRAANKVARASRRAQRRAA